MPDKQFYLDALRANAAATTEAARSTPVPLPPIAGCPGWTMADLIFHFGSVHRHVIRRVERREREFQRYNQEEWDRLLDLPSSLDDWEPDQPETPNRPLPPELITWFQEGAQRLEAALQSADPAERIGTWFPPDQTAGFWQRRMAQEMAVHRWDAQQAVGEPEPIEGELARDGIDEVFEVMLPHFSARTEARPGAGESYHFHRTDGEGEWLLRFQPEGVTVTREHGKADVAVRGTASDLLLFLWGRPTRERLEVFGDPALLDRYFELAPPG